MIKIRARILTAEQIDKMPLHNLKRYEDSIHKSKQLLRDSLLRTEFVMGIVPMNVLRVADKEEVAMIKTLDWIAARVKEAIKRKK